MNAEVARHRLPTFKLLLWAAKLHFARWTSYRANVFIWVLTIWCTIAVQVAFAIVAFNATGGTMFGHSAYELVCFLGLTLLSSGIAQCVVHGVVIHIGRCVWTGQFDYWLIQPPPLLLRFFLEDLGLVWFLPHLVVGFGILAWNLTPTLLVWGIAVALIAALVEIGITLCICIPTIRWGKWDPNAGLWEYFDRSRTVPILRSKSTLLLLVSFGVLHYSVALEVFLGNVASYVLFAFAAITLGASVLLLRLMVHAYSSASS